MKRSGFTMIELIFVIVILGILASVAIPKLSATRDDAKISKAASEVATLVSDLGAYYTGHGSFGKVGAMTNVKLYNSAAAELSADGNLTTQAFYRDTANGQNCLGIQVSALDGNLTVSEINTSTSTFCTGMRGAIKDLIKTHQFGGSSISFN